MKEMAAFVLLIVLIGVGWNQPYKAHFTSVVGEPPPVVVSPSTAAPGVPSAPGAGAPGAVEAAPDRDSSWLWKKGTLDAPDREGGKQGGGKHGR